ncbi:hypothetical protein [Longimicrobium sp.]|uniref:hypothetical protein n=1 Tax=Longimicrobium sp. TaxID=2029185 RepID=UPI002E2F37DE|nr:hypothetical protein [Longimicrobium sp.]HEX6037311.1 hypothetical protein [Longimicrobium sp.]
MRQTYADQVFINCPFDEQYRPLFQALVFVVHACGMTARTALEADNGAEVRIEKIVRIIRECCHSIHDISRVELDADSGLPRMNMAFELGLFLGAQRFGERRQKKKTCIIFDQERYRYQKYLSDIAGQDIRAHNGSVVELIRAVRNALATTLPSDVLLHSGATMAERYARFQRELPVLCSMLGMDPSDLGYRDLASLVSQWLEVNSGPRLQAA